MGQFDFPSAAALAQIKSETLTTSPIDKAVSRFAGIGSKILELAGFFGAATLTDLIQELKGLAADKDEANLIFFGESLVDDIGRLYQSNDEMRRHVDQLLKSEEFHEAVANATLHITRTNVMTRLRRVSLLIANGVKVRDLEPESLDDMMRAAVELKDRDIGLLGKIFKSQVGLLGSYQVLSSEWSQQVAASWPNDFSFLDSPDNRHVRSSLARLQSAGFVQEVSTMMARTGRVANQPYGLLPDGRKFFERVQEIADDRRS
jgi:hypothetical protein